MPSPWGGDKGGGRKPSKKRGGQPGNTNRRASKYLPRATDAEERRRFLDALKEAEDTPHEEKARRLLDLLYARVNSVADVVGVGKIISAFESARRWLYTSSQVDDRGKAKAREVLKDAAISDVWQIVCECEKCASDVDARLRALELELKQL